MKIKRWFYPLTLFAATMLFGNVQAQEEVATGIIDACQASYSTDGKLSIPCVSVSGSSYFATLQHVYPYADTRFTLVDTKPIESTQYGKSICEATYSFETGQLDIPCIAGMGGISLHAIDDILSPSSFAYRTLGHGIRSNSRCPLNSSVVKTTNVGDFTAYGYANPLDNFAVLQENYAIGNAGYPNHLGVDYMKPAGSNVYAICDGNITSDSQDFTYQQVSRGRQFYDAYWNSRIILKCNVGSNMLAIYAHVDKQTVSNGTSVKQGDKIAIVAPAYNSNQYRTTSSDHLHFGIRVGYTNPFYKNFGFGIASENVTLAQAEQYGFQDPINYLCSNPIQSSPIITSFDGAGSLISPTQNAPGGNYDVARMQPHASTGTPSTVVFQFKKDTNCDHIDISSTPIIDAIIQSKPWSDHLISTAFGGSLPMSVPNKGGYTVVAVTSARPLTSMVTVTAQCKPASSPSVNRSTTPLTDASTQLVTLGNGYYWTGTGSVISALGGSGVGKTSDTLPTFDTKKSFSSFQWQTSYACQRLELSSRAGIQVTFNTGNEILLKEWNAPDWSISTSCSRLPCTIYAPAIGKYYIVKVKTDAGATSVTSGSNTGGLNAKCL